MRIFRLFIFTAKGGCAFSLFLSVLGYDIFKSFLVDRDTLVRFFKVGGESKVKSKTEKNNILAAGRNTWPSVVLELCFAITTQIYLREYFVETTRRVTVLLSWELAFDTPPDAAKKSEPPGPTGRLERIGLLFFSSSLFELLVLIFSDAFSS